MRHSFILDKAPIFHDFPYKKLIKAQGQTRHI